MASSHESSEEIQERMQRVIAASAVLHAATIAVLNDSALRLDECAHGREDRVRTVALPDTDAHRPEGP